MAQRRFSIRLRHIRHVIALDRLETLCHAVALRATQCLAYAERTAGFDVAVVLLEHESAASRLNY